MPTPPARNEKPGRAVPVEGQKERASVFSRPGCVRFTNPVTSKNHPEGAFRPQSARASFVAVVCLLLTLLGSTVQAVHAHGAALPGGAAHLSAESGNGHFTPDDLCPLCAAMHGAAAVLGYRPAAIVKTTAVLVAAEEAPPPRRAWTVDLFGRPPPAFL